MTRRTRFVMLGAGSVLASALAATVLTHGGDAAPGATAPATHPAPPAPRPPAPGRAAQLELTFMGDIMFGGVFHAHFSAADTTTFDPLHDMAPFIASDLPLANLETTVVERIPDDHTGDLRFAATPDQVALLPKNGIKVVTVANNHHYDFGDTAVASTAELVPKLGLELIGEARTEAPAWRIETVEVKGWKLAFIAGATKRNKPQAKNGRLLPFAEPDDLAATVAPIVAEARKDHDLVFVVLHWGEQYEDAPGGWQVKAAHAFIDAGADAVIGHHPHVLQGIERYKHGLIAYSLGNFVFQNGVTRVRDTGVLRLTFAQPASASACLSRVTFHPAIELRRPIHHPVPATGRDLKELADRFIKLSGARPLATKMTLDGDHLTVPADCP